jgi:hypothetical protein
VSKYGRLTVLAPRLRRCVAGRAGLPAGEAGHHGHVQLLPRGGARQEPQEEQAHPSQPKGHPLKGGQA